MMFDDTTWTDNDVQGFQFDWDQSDQAQYGARLKSSQELTGDVIVQDQLCSSCPGLRAEVRVTVTVPELDRLTCTICHNMIEEFVLYENKVIFCSEHCWESALYAAADDFAVGGISAWPLETFCSVDAKTFLLNLACKSCDGDFIVKLLRYFQMSLSSKNFEKLLLNNKIAFNHFANFLRKTGQYQLLHDLLMSNGSVEHAKLQPYSKLTQQLNSVNMDNVEYLSHRLRVFAMTELVSDPKLTLLHESTTQLSQLLQFQYKHVCDDQFRWLIVEPMVSCAAWTEMDSILLEKKRLTRCTTLLPSDRLAMYMHSLKAPSEIIVNYLSYIHDPEEVVEIALRLGTYAIALTCCIKMRDLEAMRQLSSRIPKTAPEHAQTLYYSSLPISQWKHKQKK